MGKSRFTESQIMGMLRQVEGVLLLAEVEVSGRATVHLLILLQKETPLTGSGG